MKTRPFGAGGPQVATIGQGTWNLPVRGAVVADVKRALRLGIELGMTHLDTAEMYGDGRSEEIVGQAMQGVPRERLFIVSKVLPSNASYEGTLRACEASLQRLRTDYLDCYLLHWRGAPELEPTLRAFERLLTDGKVRSFGVSNFDVADLEEVRAHLGGRHVTCNQVLYHLEERGIERRLIPYCREHDIAVVGYSPFGSGDFPSPRSKGGETLAKVARRLDAGPRAVALAFLTRLDGTFVIPKAIQSEHVRENASAGEVKLGDDDVAELCRAFPVPGRNRPLATS